MAGYYPARELKVLGVIFLIALATVPFTRACDRAMADAGFVNNIIIKDVYGVCYNASASGNSYQRVDCPPTTTP